MQQATPVGKRVQASGIYIGSSRVSARLTANAASVTNTMLCMKALVVTRPHPWAQQCHELQRISAAALLLWPVDPLYVRKRVGGLGCWLDCLGTGSASTLHFDEAPNACSLQLVAAPHSVHLHSHIDRIQAYIDSVVSLKNM